MQLAYYTIRRTKHKDACRRVAPRRDPMHRSASQELRGDVGTLPYGQGFKSSGGGTSMLLPSRRKSGTWWSGAGTVTRSGPSCRSPVQ
jgi:hypothetical protein